MKRQAAAAMFAAIGLSLSAGERVAPPDAAPSEDTSGVTAVAFAPDGESFLTGFADGVAVLRETATGRVLRRLEGHSASVQAAAFDPAGPRIMTGSADGTAVLWDREGRPLRTFRTPAGRRDEPGEVHAVAFGPDGRSVVTGSSRRVGAFLTGLAIVWDGETGERQQMFAHESPVAAVAAAPGGRDVWTGSYGEPQWEGAPETGILTRWGIETGLAADRMARPVGRITSVAVAADGQRVVTNAEGHDAIVWDVVTAEPLRTLRHEAEVTAVAITSRGETILAGCRDGTATLWKTGSGRRLGTLGDRGPAVLAVAFAADGRRALVAWADGTVSDWQVGSAGRRPSQ